MKWRMERLLRKAHRLGAEQRFDDALVAAEEALTLDRTCPAALLQTAMLHLDRGEPAQALSLLEEGAAGQKRNPAWPVFLGLAHADLGQLEQARHHLREALRMERENRLAHGLLGMVWMRCDQPERALKILDAWGIEASPRLIGRLLAEVEKTINRLGAHDGKGTRNEGGTRSEVAAVGEVPSSDTGDDDNLPWDASSARHGPIDSVIGAVIDPPLAQAHLARAEKLLFAQRPIDAIDYARRAVHRYPDVPRGFCILGLAYLQDGQPGKALRCLEEASRRDGQTPDVLYAQGCCYHEMGDLARARERLNKMLAAFAKDASAHYTLGQIDLKEGDELGARRHFERAAYLDFLLVQDRMKRLKSALAEAGGGEQ